MAEEAGTPDTASTRRAARVVGVSCLVWIALLVQVDRSDAHLELRELRWWQAAAVALGMLGSAGGVYVAAQYGPWSWLPLVRRYGRDVALVHLSLSIVVALYVVSLLFR